MVPVVRVLWERAKALARCVRADNRYVEVGANWVEDEAAEVIAWRDVHLEQLSGDERRDLAGSVLTNLHETQIVASSELFCKLRSACDRRLDSQLRG